MVLTKAVNPYLLNMLHALLLHWSNEDVFNSKNYSISRMKLKNRKMQE